MNICESPSVLDTPKQGGCGGGSLEGGIPSALQSTAAHQCALETPELSYTMSKTI